MYCRLYRSSDFAACLPLVNRGLQLAPPVRAALPTLWQRLLDGGQLYGGVVVGPGSFGQDSILSFAMAVFLSETFVAEYLEAPTPYPAAAVYERILDGRSPVLAPGEMAKANSSRSLNLFILHFGLLDDLADERARAAIATSHTGFRLFFVGYHVRRVLQEAYGAAQLPFFTAGGFVLKSDYSHHYAAVGHEPPMDNDRPYLMGLYRDDRESAYPGAGITYLFQSAESRFQFSPAEQRVLLRALMDEPDEAIADALGVSRDAVKNAWRRIHERVIAVAPDLYVHEPHVEGVRGKERRRQLLYYLRHHLEELRPTQRRR